MRTKVLALALASVFALSACETTGGAYGSNGSYGGGGTQLSRCMRQALIGVGVGAVTGALIGSEHNRGENAALGAALGGAATYGVCRWMDARDQARVEQGYQRALTSNSGYSDHWQSDQGAPRSLVVDRPVVAQGRPECRTVNAAVTDQEHGHQPLPAETFCRNPDGSWAPV